MPGFDGLDEAAKILKTLRKESVQKKRDARWKRGGATLGEMEEVYQEQRGKFSKAYFSGSPIYVGDSFKNWYLGSERGRRDFGNAIVFGAIMGALADKK